MAANSLDIGVGRVCLFSTVFSLHCMAIFCIAVLHIARN
jgi:hypothetical protein